MHKSQFPKIDPYDGFVVQGHMIYQSVFPRNQTHDLDVASIIVGRQICKISNITKMNQRPYMEWLNVCELILMAKIGFKSINPLSQRGLNNDSQW